MSATRSAYGWVLPASDRHFPKFLSTAPKVEGRRMYQASHIQQSTRFCLLRRTAIDVGGHVGFWSYYLALGFQRVHAFEPNDLFAQCFERNVRSKSVTLHRIALGETERRIALEVDPQNTGATHVSDGVEGAIPMRRLDDFAFDEVDFIKIDVEGFERQVVEGARETLLRCKPVVIVEQKSFAGRYGSDRYAAGELLQSLGAGVLTEVAEDLVFGWPGSPVLGG